MVNNIVLSGMAWVSSIKNGITERISEESGQDLLEYAVLVGFIAVALAAAFILLPLGTSMNTFATKIGQCISFNNAC